MYQDTSLAVNRDQPQGESIPRIGERGVEICGDGWGLFESIPDSAAEPAALPPGDCRRQACRRCG